MKVHFTNMNSLKHLINKISFYQRDNIVTMYMEMLSYRVQYLEFMTAGTFSDTRITTGWKARVRLSVGTRDLSLLHSVQTSSEDHPFSHPMGTGDYVSGSKAARA
jgi:hypothetical protein